MEYAMLRSTLPGLHAQRRHGVDLDHFKLLNDTYGHEGGDRALRVFATAVHEMLRGTDVAGRYGGEEFVFAFPDRAPAEALMAIERLRSGLRVATESGACPSFTASFGLAEWEPKMTVDELLRVADDRLRQAKLTGRNRVVSESSPTEFATISANPPK
jgi:diguanylate cyclase (GGDEF)-like protein